jgi:hypothetical protein
VYELNSIKAIELSVKLFKLLAVEGIPSEGVVPTYILKANFG